MIKITKTVNEYKLNKEQLEAANFVNGNLLIIASAGTGKTTTIIERYFNLINNQNYKPNEILMTTFTNKAAKDMTRKISERAGKEPGYIGTMHSIFLKILRNNSSLVLPGSDFTIIDEYDKGKIMKNVLVSEKIDTKADNIKYFLMWITKFKNRGVLAEDLSLDINFDDKNDGVIEDILDDNIIKVDTKLRKHVNKIYKKYEEDLRKHNLIDLDDILLLTFKLFNKNNEIKEFYAKKFKAIMVDEAQDLNVVQIKILNLLQNNNLCLIGDDCQNIYEWRGSSNELVFDFNEHHNRIFLKDNYRSGKEIISAVNKIIESMSFKIEKQLNCTKNFNGNINVESFFNLDEEANFIVQEVKKLLKNKVPRDEISVLFRTNRIGKFIEREFRRNKIPCHLSKSRDFFEREEIKDILSFLKLKLNPYSTVDFERLILLLNGFGLGKVRKFEEIVIKNKCSYLDALNYLKLNPDSVKELNRLKNALESSGNPFNVFLKNFGYVNYLKEKYVYEDEKLKDKLENIKVFEDLFEGKGNREEIKEFLDSLIEIEKKEKTRDKVTLSTIHSAKGLEWGHVFLACCNEKTLPFYIDDLGKAKRDSELRLFYVALSRAKNSLFITYHDQTDWGQEMEKSQFLDILDY